MGVIFVFFQAIGSKPSRKRSLKRSVSNGSSTFALCAFPRSSMNSVSARLIKKVGKGSNPGEELVFMRARFCSMCALRSVSTGMSYKGGWSGLCGKNVLVSDPFLNLSPGPGGMAMSAGVICLVRSLFLRAWWAQGSLGIGSLGVIVYSGVSVLSSSLSIHVLE